ncbi:MAG: alpha/beta hydrolase [Rhizobiaceae bacterium]|nr:alpha/beta hydrolase [Rhizobiaceae bacterium]
MVLASMIACLPAHAEQFAPYKDELFAYPGIIETAEGGSFRVVDYDEMRDINARDEEPERRVQAKYVSLGVRKVQQELVANTDAGQVRHVAVGKTEGASVIVVYMHGQGGDRRQGVNDFTFGGNFNRIKNMTVAAGGLYLSPDVASFDDAGAARIAALVAIYAARSPKAEIYLACGSMGGTICWRLANDKTVAPRLGGLLLLGSLWDEKFLSSAAFKRKVPVFMGQGSRDKVFPAERVRAFYGLVRSRTKDYPIRMVVFESGSHGTPIRMTDWREVINWMASR